MLKESEILRLKEQARIQREREEHFDPLTTFEYLNKLGK